MIADSAVEAVMEAIVSFANRGPTDEPVTPVDIAYAVLNALGIPEDADLLPFHKVGRMDGESVDGEHTWNVCDGPDDWTTPEANDDQESVYYIDSYLRIGHVERTFGEPDPDDDEPAVDNAPDLAALGIVKHPPANLEDDDGCPND